VDALQRRQAKILRRLHRAQFGALTRCSTWSAREGISKQGISCPSINSHRP
jgi:hypothetical protein